MSFDIVRQVLRAVVSYLQTEFTLEGYTFSYYEILTWFVAFSIACVVLHHVLED